MFTQLFFILSIIVIYANGNHGMHSIVIGPKNTGNGF